MSVLSETYKRVRPAVVSFAIRQESHFMSFGSGVCIDPSGIIVTAKHVITGYYEYVNKDIHAKPEFEVCFTERLTDGQGTLSVDPKALVMDLKSDIAVIKIFDKEGGWPYVPINSEIKLDIGEYIATAGYPLRGDGNFSMLPDLFMGIVSNIQEHYEEGIGMLVDNLILDISIHPGNSGGPVFNINNGELLGIVSSQRLRNFSITEQLAQISNNENLNVNVWTNIVNCVPIVNAVPLLPKLTEIT